MERTPIDLRSQARLSVNQISQILKRANGSGVQMNGFHAARPVLPRINRQAIRLKMEEEVIRLSLEHPGWGPERLSKAFLALRVDIGSHAIYNILGKYQMATKNERLQALEAKFAGNVGQLSEEQLRLLEKKYPSFRERNSRGAAPGELLVQDATYVGVSAGGGEVYLQAVIDTFSNYAFGFLYTSKAADSAVSLLHNDVLPFFQKLQLQAAAILTDNGREYCGKNNHHYELYLNLNRIEHQRAKSKGTFCKGVIKEFLNICFAEFFKKHGATPLGDLETLQKDLERWLSYYNLARSRQGFPNMGRPPMELIREYLAGQHSPN